MTKLGAELIYELDGLDCALDLLGKSITVERAGVRYRIDLPERADAFQFVHASVNSGDPRAYEPTVAFFERSSDMIELRLIRVVANLDVPDTWDREDETGGEDAVLRRIIAGSKELATELCNWTRILQRQDWMEPPGSRPELVSAARLADISDEETATLLPTMLLQTGTIKIIPPEGVLDLPGLAAVSEAVKSRGSPTAEELLLADAQHRCRWRQGPLEPDMAILLAAIATEIRTKRALREHATEAQTALVEVLLDNPRDWSLSAHAYFAKAIEAVVGRELGAEWGNTAKAVQRMFAARNDIAHRGEHFDEAQARAHVDAATSAFRLLDALDLGRSAD